MPQRCTELPDFPKVQVSVPERRKRVASCAHFGGDIPDAYGYDGFGVGSVVGKRAGLVGGSCNPCGPIPRMYISLPEADGYSRSFPHIKAVDDAEIFVY